MALAGAGMSHWIDRETYNLSLERSHQLRARIVELEEGARRLVRAQERMLMDWAEDGDGPFTRTRADLWRDLHVAGDELRALLDEPEGERS